MRQSIVLKTFIGLAAMAAIGGAVVWGVAQSTEVRGDSAVPAGPGAAPEAADTLSEEEPAVEYLRRLSERDLATYTHPSGVFSFRYPKAFELLTTSPDAEEQGVDALHPDLPLEISLRAYPRDQYVPDIPEAFTTYQWPAPGGDDNEAIVFLEEKSALFSNGARYRGTMWFEAGTALFEIKLYAPEVPLLVEWMDQFISADLTITTSASSLW
jgi:hypothetical protein